MVSIPQQIEFERDIIILERWKDKNFRGLTIGAEIILCDAIKKLWDVAILIDTTKTTPLPAEEKE